MAEGDQAREKIISEVEAANQPEKAEAAFYQPLEKEGEQTKRSLEDSENSDILDMRKRWGDQVLALIWIIVLFDIVLVVFYGIGYLNFADPRVVMVVVTENFLKVIGLGAIITNKIFEKIFKQDS